MAETTDIDDTAEYPGPAKARADAERLDWLERARPSIAPVTASTKDHRWGLTLDPWHNVGHFFAPSLREAIDRAMDAGG